MKHDSKLNTNKSFLFSKIELNVKIKKRDHRIYLSLFMYIDRYICKENVMCSYVFLGVFIQIPSIC